MKVSILICTYNSGNYILATILSVLNQSLPDFELLILDNSSTDNTIEKIKSFNDRRIKLYEWKSNIWPYAWLNFLLEKAKGDYIAIQDHDDIWAQKKLEKQVNFLETNKEYIWCWTKTVMYYENDEQYFLYYLKEKNYYTIHPSLVFRNIWNIKYDESLMYFWDAYFQKKILCKDKKLIYNLDEPLTLHLIKKWYSNFTFSWFKINIKFIKRIIDVHSITLYSIFVIWYEIIKKFMLFIIKKLDNYKLYVWFDRLPYKLSWNKFKDIKDAKDEQIIDMYKQIKRW